MNVHAAERRLRERVIAPALGFGNTASGVRTARRPRRAWLTAHGWAALLVGGGIFGIAYLGLQGTPAGSAFVFNGLGVASVVSIAVAAAQQKAARVPWLLIAAGQLMFVTGDVLAYNYHRLFGTPLPFPSIADPFYLATYPFLIAGLLLLMRLRTPAHDRAALIDTAIVWTGAGVLAWTVLIAPYFHDPTLSVGTKLTSIAYPVMDLGVLACVLRFVLGSGRRGTSSALLLAGTISLLVTDSVYGWFLLHGGYSGGGLLDAGWIAFYLLLGAAALHPHAGRLVEQAPDKAFRLTRARAAMLAVATLAAPGVLATQALTGNAVDVLLLASFSAVAFALVMLRLFDLVGRHHTALCHATALANTAGAFIVARTDPEVVAAALDAARRIVGPRSTVSFSPDTAAAADDDLWIPLTGRFGRRGALIVHRGRGCDADTASSLELLANQTVLALDGVALASELIENEARAHFESLVQNASDVIMVVDSLGGIGFVSPSAGRVLGIGPAELEGRMFLDLVGPSDRPRIAHVVLSETLLDPVRTLEFELEVPRGRVEIEATFTDLSNDASVSGLLVTLRDIGERKEFERQLTDRAFNDDLTGLANRVLFRERVEHALARLKRNDGRLAVFFLDLDDFKTINDSLGHNAGDELLQIVGQRIAAELRPGDTAARLGGDEFAVLVENGNDLRSRQTAERLLEVISAPIALAEHEVSIQASIGLTEAAADCEETASTLLRQADVAMYSAKDSGKAGYRTFAPEMHARVLERLQLTSALKHALANDEFELHYQPIVDLASRRVDFLEALLRWRHPDEGLIPPGDFVPLAEETGLIVPIGAWVLEEAASEAMRLRDLLGEDAPAVSVNVSARQLQRPEFADEVQALLERTGLPPGSLILEATETMLMDDLELVAPIIEALKVRGVRFAIDDFGTGYSSLNYIRRLPVDILKIDRSFIADIDHSPTLTRTILELAASLNILAVAEGIEEQSEHDALRRMGCVLGQGFLLMRPTPAPGMETALLEHRHVFAGA